MDTKYISKISLIVLISISIVMVSCSNKASRISDIDKNHKEYYINVFLNNFFATATDAYIVVNVKNKSKAYPAITTLDCLVSYVIKNSFNHDISNDFIKEECRNYLLNDSVLKDNIGILYTPNSTEEFWATKGENKYLKHYVLDYLIIENITEEELNAVIYRLINWGYFVYSDGWGVHVIKNKTID